MSWTVIEQFEYNSFNNEKFLLSKEQRWIYRLSTQYHGLNDSIPWHSLNS